MHKKIESFISPKKLMELEKIIGYQFNNTNNLKEAITHRSFANEHRNHQMKDNERLEFLGDAILDLIISKYLFDKYPVMPEGDLSKVRASIVCEGSLAKTARNIDLGAFILLGKGEEMTGGRTRNSILADAFEAVTGAIFVDGAFEDVVKFLQTTLIENVDSLSVEDLYTDYKTILQENIQKESMQPLHYEVVDEKGPDHDKDFYVAVYHGELCLGKGIGKSKKEAEQQAAKTALKALEK
ncbi:MULTISPECIES: ribonuclease III [Zhenhengia]|jgi:ribonuclease-3|uniref:Ribonuclease 3 n=1 Tax=Zhenhengia yiwuensis TaxID=2763666 RepID=A0A926EJA5_9FIRM|nr:ribonuclease III [Zhenhengia yiwuensis]MBP3911102.1 ribonuclease III [Niameybacter sp.]MBS5315804.1 ribonuclease III [Clostridiales bacterium]MBC8579432.1 ribonuclease III [Zhenhengia yiwuensis]MBS5798332.1 ribonuclease III [Clostridiales bacterium]MDU6359735.1 ribonuclease III [Clostridiales bacterium]